MFYGVEIWGGSFDSHLLKLEQIIVDGMRLVTGATARSNIANLFEETSWQSFSDRKDDAMLIMMYKIKKGLAPNYLTEILPKENQEINRYNLRNNKNIRIPFTKSETFKRSFIPTAVRLWNELCFKTRESISVSVFKSNLKSTNKIANILFYYGQRWPAIHHARLRIGCSKLNYDLCYNLHLPDIDPSCSCGVAHENASHFFISCPNYTQIRTFLRNKLEPVCKFELNIMLYGSSNLTTVENKLVFDAVHEFIVESQRFI